MTTTDNTARPAPHIIRQPETGTVSRKPVFDHKNPITLLEDRKMNPIKSPPPHPDPIWYPFTQMQELASHPPLAIAEAEGCWLIDGQGRRYLDGVSSLWANLHGHRHPRINAAIREQLGKVAHTTMLGLTHPLGPELARRLTGLAPSCLTRVFYSDSGATAVEVALKMAYQYCQLKGEEHRTRFISLEQAYHGDTIGAVSVGGMPIFHERFSKMLFDATRIPAPDMYRHPFGNAEQEQVAARYIDQAEAIIRANAETACALVIEPLIQGAAGMICHPPGFLAAMRNLTRQLGILLIVDEVAVGFGRTGKMFACEWEAVEPDLMCLGKGISGGYLPLAATLASEEIFSAFLGDYAEFKTFFHGHTYTGNPLACAAGIASLDIFESEQTLAPEIFGPKAAQYAHGMRGLLELEHVGSARWRGLMGGVELVRDKSTKTAYAPELRMGHKVIMTARKRGVMLRPLGDVIVLLPPLAISQKELELLFSVTREAIQEATSSS